MPDPADDSHADVTGLEGERPDRFWRETLTIQIEAGADESIGEAPVDRFSLPTATAGRATAGRATQAPTTQLASRPRSVPEPPPRNRPLQPVRLESTDAAAATAREVARAATSLEALREAVAAFDGCGLKKTAMNTVFADGAPDGRVMLIGEAPGAEEDRQGKPFVGASGQLLDKMLAAIGLSRDADAYIANIVFWRPPGNREPRTEEIAVCRPFLERHIELKRPELLVFLGGPSAKTMLNRKEGITRLRGRWFEYQSTDMADAEAPSIPAIPLFHPAYLLRSPLNKREAWRDLLAIQDRLNANPTGDQK